MNGKPSSQLMVVFVGTPGSGKSALAIQWCTIFQNWVRINQDELLTRYECKKKAHAALKQGKSVIIDRCNFNQEQRSVWVEIAKKHKVFIDFLEFRIPLEVLKQKILNRKGHPNGIQGERGVEILTEFVKNIQSCHINEGSERIIVFPFAYQEPLFDIKTWTWLSKAFSVPLKFVNFDQKRLINTNSTNDLSLMPWIIRCKKKIINSKPNQELSSPALKNYYDRLAKPDSDKPRKSHSAEIENKNKLKVISPVPETKKKIVKTKSLAIKEKQTPLPPKNIKESQTLKLDPTVNPECDTKPPATKEKLTPLSPKNIKESQTLKLDPTVKPECDTKPKATPFDPIEELILRFDNLSINCI